MKRALCLALLGLAIASQAVEATDTVASVRKDCEVLKQEIAAKIEANGVRHYQLQIVEPEAEQVGRIVGSCNGGTRRIAYQRQTLPQLNADLAMLPAGAPETAAQNEL